MPAHKVRSKLMACLLTAIFSLVCVVSPAYADLVTTEQLATSAELQSQRDALNDRLLREDVKQQLIVLGVDPGTVQERINHMSAAEISQIQGQLDDLPAGGVLGTIALVLIILILLEITGSIDIFPRI